MSVKDTILAEISSAGLSIKEALNRLNDIDKYVRQATETPDPAPVTSPLRHSEEDAMRMEHIRVLVQKALRANNDYKPSSVKEFLAEIDLILASVQLGYGHPYQAPKHEVNSNANS